MNVELPISLYIHIPWCVRKCPYCDFNSHENKRELPESDYVAALCQDLDNDALQARGRILTSLFFGGGTPSLFSPAAIAQIIEHAERSIGFAEDVEITLEANPGTVEQDKFVGYRAAGVNRLSIGVQSFNPVHLQALGRIHGREEALRARAAADSAGIHNVNLDLMYGLPTQTLEDAQTDLATAISLQPTHISHYQLTLEPNTPFYRQPPKLPTDDAVYAMQQQCELQLAEAGYQHYEISAYSKNSGWRARHNINYWEFGDYLGIGAGAHAKFTDANGQVHRVWKHKHPRAYLEGATNGNYVAGSQRVEAHELPFEFMMNALRLLDGVASSLFTERTGMSLDALSPQLILARQRGWLAPYDKQLLPTLQGRLFLNDLLQLFLPEREAP